MIRYSLFLFMGSLSLGTGNMLRFLDDEEGKFKNLLFLGLTHEYAFVKNIFKYFYTYLTVNIKDFKLR